MAVHYWGKLQSSKHSHWRHPQTLIMKISGIELEFIGGHLKSKINTMQPIDEAGKLMADFVDEALRARVRLVTEASDIRRYIERKFEQEANPRVFVCGDMNDGPGRGYFEPGADALPSEPVNPTRFQLIDHILFTQSLVGKNASPRVKAHAGLIEHTIHQRNNALLTNVNRTSDHVPESVHITL